MLAASLLRGRARRLPLGGGAASGAALLSSAPGAPGPRPRPRGVPPRAYEPYGPGPGAGGGPGPAYGADQGYGQGSPYGGPAAPGYGGGGAPAAAAERAPGDPQGQVRAYVGYRIYKGKAAVSFNPIRASFAPFTDGAGNAALRLDRKGSLLLEFAAALGERQYDWANKQLFALSPDELGSLLAEAGEGVSFFHDPNMGGDGQGLVQKSLKVSPTQDGKGYFFSLEVKDHASSASTRISVPVSKGEFAVLSSLVNSIIPSLLGWDVWRDVLQVNREAGGGGSPYPGGGPGGGYDSGDEPPF